MKLIDFFENIYLPKRLRGKSPNSVRLYRLCIRQFGRTLCKTAEVADLTEPNVLRHLARRKDVAPATRNKELSELTAMWRLAARMKLLETWPEIQPEHEPEREPIAWLPEELAMLLAECKRQTGEIGNVPAWLWWTGIVHVILDTGERVTAVIESEWSWVQGEWLRIPAEHRKGKTRDRQYKLSAGTAELLEQIRQFGERKIFPWPLNRNYLWERYKRIVDSAGLPTGRKYQFHALRKTVGSVVYAAGLDP
jgi:integrase